VSIDSRDTPESLFERASADHVASPGVIPGTGFGSNPGLRINRKIFAMLVRGELVVKLPEDRVVYLVAAGFGRRFDPGQGKPMREWLAVPAAAATRWPGLISEAREFVGR
jgi:hypothetical protein